MNEEKKPSYVRKVLIGTEEDADFDFETSSFHPKRMKWIDLATGEEVEAPELPKDQPVEYELTKTSFIIPDASYEFIFKVDPENDAEEKGE